MGIIISKFAFLPPPPSYNSTIAHLSFVKREDTFSSFINKYKIPIRYYHLNDNAPCLLICHGNAEDIGQSDPEQLAIKLECNICMFDYAGYGLHSCKSPSEYHCEEDVRSVYDHLILVRKIDPNKIVIWGRSLGTGIACYLAHNLSEQNIIHKLILISPLLSCTHIVTDYEPPVNMFMNYLRAPSILSPTLILHGNYDNVVPYEHGERLSKLFPNLHKFVTLNGVGHNDIMYVDTLYNEIYQFVHAQ